MRNGGRRVRVSWCRVALAVALLAAGLTALTTAALANDAIIPYGAEDWRYQVYAEDPPAGWHETGFDDSQFALGRAPFGVQGPCPITVHTEWPLGTRIVLRRSFDVRVSTVRLSIGVAYDNQVQVFVNGVEVGAAGGPEEVCATYNRAIFSVSADLLHEYGNVIAVLGTDYGEHSLLDVAVEAIIGGGPRPPPPAPPPGIILNFTASDDRADGVHLTWTDVLNEDGYDVFRDRELVGSTGLGETTFLDVPPVGTYTYCVEAFNAIGRSNTRCDMGTRMPVDAPGPCAASDNSSRQVVITWTDVAGEDGYRVHRDGTLICSTGPGETQCIDSPGPGSPHQYCVEAFNALGASLPCCDAGVQLPLVYPGPCAASDTDYRQVVVTWTDVEGEDGYNVYRDGALVHIAEVGATSWIDTPGRGTYQYCVEAFNTQGVSHRCCNTGTVAAPPAPSWCEASDGETDGVLFRWADAAEATGYRIYRDDAPVHTAVAGETSWFDVPAVGEYAYCVEAVYDEGVSPRCCDGGRRLALPVPPVCDATDTDAVGVQVTWAEVAGADGYRVYRGSELVYSAGPGETSYYDVPFPGTYPYCVEAFNALGTSPRCCDSGTRLASGGALACAASDNSTAGVWMTWGNWRAVQGFWIYRDGELVHENDASDTTYFDVPPPGTYEYCVEPFDQGTAQVRCCDAGTRLPAPPGPPQSTVRFSWDTCSPQVPQQDFAGPGIYRLVISATGIDEPVLGHDTTIHIAYWLSDAWRFDDAGCQAGGFSATPTGVAKACPALLGANPMTIVNFHYDTVRQIGIVRLAATFDDLMPYRDLRYTLWQVMFDHTRSVVGPSEPGVSCGGAEIGYFLDGVTELLTVRGEAVHLGYQPGDATLTWNDGPRVRTLPTSWGRLKALYR